MSTTARTALARGLGRGLRVAGRGGTSLPGKVLLRIDPHAIARLAGSLPRGSAVISATNGKTTTTALAAAILDAAGVATLHNVAGANMAGGIAAALLERRRGAQFGLFEVDEFWLDRVAGALDPEAIVLSNLFRDQLDRYGELEAIADRWAALTARLRARLILNADDPLIADLGRGRAEAVFFGIEDRAATAGTAASHASDSTHCRRCGAAFDYECFYIAHLGIYACPGCGAKRPVPAVAAHDVSINGLRGSSFELRTPRGSASVRLSLPGLYNVYNALGAAALATALDIEPGVIAAGLAGAGAVFGRGERVSIERTELSILLVKNPAGANEVLRLLGSQPGPHELLAVLNDRIADGRDVSWIWDADYETLAPRIGWVTCSGSRAAEMALRLKYAGVPAERIAVVPALDAALEQALAREPGELYALPTYTAMLALRELLAKGGRVRGSWDRRS